MYTFVVTISNEPTNSSKMIKQIFYKNEINAKHVCLWVRIDPLTLGIVVPFKMYK